VELNPEVTNTATGAPCCQSGQGAWHYDQNPQIGGNIRWTLGSNYVLNGTVKPDFSQVEADATQIAADARFALFYAEKRPFFVEGQDQFNVPNSLVYTRTIVRPDAAAKFTGKLGRADIAVLSALDQSPSSFTTRDRPLVDIVRLRQNFGEQSLAGLVYSERVGGAWRRARTFMYFLFRPKIQSRLRAEGEGIVEGVKALARYLEKSVAQKAGGG